MNIVSWFSVFWLDNKDNFVNGNGVKFFRFYEVVDVLAAFANVFGVGADGYKVSDFEILLHVVNCFRYVFYNQILAHLLN